MKGGEPIATSSQTVGPFFHFGLTRSPNGRMVDRFRDPVDPVRLRIRVRDGDGQPVPDAMIELYQDGVFGRMPTNADGACEFETIRPRGSRASGAPHVNVLLFARGLLRQLHTRIYFAGETALDADPVLALVPEPRRETLIATAASTEPGLWLFDINLQGTQETVFFDV